MANKEQQLPTPLQQFYADKVILITGGTGFLGKGMPESIMSYIRDCCLLKDFVKLLQFLSTVLLHKLLTACPDVKQAYVIVRQKRGQDIQTRLRDLYNDAVRKS